MTEPVVAPAPDAGQAPAPTTWTDGFDDTTKGYIENKGFTDAQALATSYQNLEKLRGVPEDQLLRFPEDRTAEGAMDPVYAKMGRPETSGEYTNVIGDGFDSGAFNSIADRAHQLGLGDGQFQGLQEIMQEQSASILTAQEEASTAAFDTWKAGNPEGFQNAARVMAGIGMNEESISAMLSGDKSAIYDFAARVGAKTAEVSVVQGDAPGSGGEFGMSKQAASAKIAELWADPEFTKQYQSGNRTVRQPAIDRMTKLHEAANGKQG